MRTTPLTPKAPLNLRTLWRYVHNVRYEYYDYDYISFRSVCMTKDIVSRPIAYSTVISCIDYTGMLQYTVLFDWPVQLYKILKRSQNLQFYDDPTVMNITQLQDSNAQL